MRRKRLQRGFLETLRDMGRMRMAGDGSAENSGDMGRPCCWAGRKMGLTGDPGGCSTPCTNPARGGVDATGDVITIQPAWGEIWHTDRRPVDGVEAGTDAHN